MAAYSGFETTYQLFEGTNCVDNQLPSLRQSMNSNNVQYNSEMFPHSLPFDPVIPAEWLSIGMSPLLE